MKKYDFTTFNFKGLNGEELEITCFTYETQYNWGHRCYVFYNNMQLKDEKITYYNRTWECFKYESLLNKVVDVVYPGKKQKMERDFIRKQIQAIADREREECDRWVADFKKFWSGLSDNTKKVIQKAGVTVNSIEEAESLIKSAGLIDTVLKA